MGYETNADAIAHARAMRMDSEVGTPVERQRILGELANRLSQADALIEDIRSRVINTDGDYLDGDDFDGLAGEIQSVLREHGAIPESANAVREESADG